MPNFIPKRKSKLAGLGGRSRGLGRSTGRRAAFDSRRALWFVVPVGLAALVLTIARPDLAQNRSAARTTQTSAAASAAPAPVVEAVGAAAVQAQRQRRDLSFYTREVHDNLFSAPQPAPPPPAPPVVVPAPVAVVLPDINPFEDWAYTGTVNMGGQLTALIENSKTKEGQFVKVGDSVLGARVDSITDGMVTIVADGKPRMLAKTDTVNVKQLDKDAPLSTTTAAPPAPGAPAMMVPGQAPADNGGGGRRRRGGGGFGGGGGGFGGGGGGFGGGGFGRGGGGGGFGNGGGAPGG